MFLIITIKQHLIDVMKGELFGEDITDKRLKVKIPEPFKVVVKMDKPLDEMELKDLSNQIKGSINNGNLGRKIK